MSTVTRSRTGTCLIAAAVAIATLACVGSARAQTGPAAPGALQVTARSESSLSLRWKDRSQSEAYYKVRVSGHVRRLAPNRQAITVTGLRPSVAYRIAVQACSRAGRCSKAATGTATTAGAPSAPAPSTSQPGPGTATEPAPTGAPPTATSPPAATTPPALTTPPAPSRPTPLPAPPGPPAPPGTVDVAGTVTVTTGNCMPPIGGSGNQINPCRTSPAAGARVLLYTPVLTYSPDLLGTLYPRPALASAQTTTDAAGHYHLAVEPGTYSFLVDTGGAAPECGAFGPNWSACPHTLLSPGQIVDLSLDHAVW